MPLRVRLLTVVAVLLAAALAASSLIVTAMMRTYLLDRTDEELRTYGEIAAAVAYGTGAPRRSSRTSPSASTGWTGRASSRSPRPPPSPVPSRPSPTSPGPTRYWSRRRNRSRSSRSGRTTPTCAGGRSPASTPTGRGLRRRRAPAADGGDARELPRVRAPHRRGGARRRARDRLVRGPPRLPTADPDRGHGRRHRRGRPDTTRPRARDPRRGRLALPLAQRHARQDRAVLRGPGGERGAHAPVRRRRVAQLGRRWPRFAGTPSCTDRAPSSNPDDVAGAFGRIESEASRMSGLVEDLLVLAWLEVGDHWSSTTSTWPSSAARRHPGRAGAGPDRHIRLVGLDGPLGPVHVLGDEQRLRQVVANLVSNALHHTPTGTPVEIAVGNRPNGCAALEVRDHGDGIDQRGPAGSSSGSTGRTPPAAGAATAPPARPASDWPSSPRSSVRTTERLASGRRPAGARPVLELPQHAHSDATATDDGEVD